MYEELFVIAIWYVSLHFKWCECVLFVWTFMLMFTLYCIYILLAPLMNQLNQSYKELNCRYNGDGLHWKYGPLCWWINRVCYCTARKAYKPIAGSYCVLLICCLIMIYNFKSHGHMTQHDDKPLVGCVTS